MYLLVGWNLLQKNVFYCSHVAVGFRNTQEQEQTERNGTGNNRKPAEKKRVRLA
jgi:hypothetical protein